MKTLRILALLGLTIAAQANAATTYTYKGPNLFGLSDSLVVSFTTSKPLAKSTSYLTPAAAGVTQGSISVVDAKGVALAGFSLPLFNLQVHTDTTGAIDSWFIVGNGINYVGTAPTMSGSFYQVYTMNTLKFIPGSDIPGSVGLVTGPYDYDQATETTYYTTCANAPVGCTLAGNGQPYVSNFGSLINPSNTSGASWTVTNGGTTPPPPPPKVLPVTISGALAGGKVNNAYTDTLTVSGGVPPYSWSASKLPAGLVLSNGVISGTPTAAATTAVTVTVTDSSGLTGHLSGNITIAPAAPKISCTAPTGTGVTTGLDSLGKITAVNGNVVTFQLSSGAKVVVTVPNCATIEWNGASAFAVGQQFEWNGYYSPATGNVAQSVVIN